MAAYDHPKVGRGGWCTWIQPVPKGYRMSCCDCGLVHELQFSVVRNRGRLPRRRLVVIFRARRSARATAAVRREREKAKQRRKR